MKENEFVQTNALNIDIRDIMKQIEALAISMEGDEKGYTNNINWSVEIDNDTLVRNTQILHRIWDIPFNRPILHQGKFTIIKYFIKRVIRKMVFWYVGPSFVQQREFNAHIVRTIESMVQTLEHQGDLLRNTELMFENVNKLISQNQLVNESLKKLNSDLETRVFNLESANNINFDYLGFEERYRGAQEHITQKQRQYIQYFDGKTNVVDLGCGRGEMLDLFREYAIAAIGVDSNKTMVDTCRKKGHRVYETDILNFLENSQDEHFDGIYLGQVIEHLTNNQLEYLLRLIFKKLKLQGVMIMETPNPQTLSVFSQAYLLDPTHVVLRHPLTMEYILEDYGFKDIKIIYSSPMPAEYKVSHLFADPQISERMNKWEAILFGNQDYAIVATK